MNPKAISDSFFRSYLFTSKSLYSIEEIIEWMKLKNKRHQFKVSRIAFNEMEHWHFEHKSGDLVHSTNRFFRVEALSCKQNFGQVRSWQQPIINNKRLVFSALFQKSLKE